jgi:hypothetical protein
VNAARIGYPDIIGAILADPHVSPAFKQHLTTPAEFLEHRYEKAQRRRLLDEPEPVTGFGDDMRTLAERAVDYAEYVRELRDDCRSIDERDAA